MLLEVGLPRGLLARVSVLSLGLVHRPGNEESWAAVERDGLVCAGPASGAEEMRRLQRGLRARSGSVAPILDSAEAVDEAVLRRFVGAGGGGSSSSSGECELLLLSDAARARNGALLSAGCYASAEEKRLSAWALDSCKMSVSQVVRSTWPVFPTWSTARPSDAADTAAADSNVGLRKRGSSSPERWEARALLQQQHNASNDDDDGAVASVASVASVAVHHRAYTSGWWWTLFVVACPMLVGGGVWLVSTSSSTTTTTGLGR